MHVHGVVTGLALVALAVAPGVRGAAHTQCIDGTPITDPKLGALSARCNNRDDDVFYHHAMIGIPTCGPGSARSHLVRRKRWSNAQGSSAPRQGAKALDLRSAFRRLRCDIRSEVGER
jgi:hypothetical protein